MKFWSKIMLLCLFTIIAIGSIFLLKPIPQNPTFHNFADRKTLVDIPNCLNVISNLPFIIVGILGMSTLKRSTAKQSMNIIYGVLFSGIILIGLGSSWYHIFPNNNSLVYDRIPMTIVFMVFLCAVMAEYINVNVGTRLLLPLITLGITSVIYWNYTESIGEGDLRFYGLVQFYPMVAIPLILLLFSSPANRTNWRFLMWVVIWYVIAKVLERFDSPIYSSTGFISGHSLKHMTAAVSTLYMVKIFKRNYR